MNLRLSLLPAPGRRCAADVAARPCARRPRWDRDQPTVHAGPWVFASTAVGTQVRPWRPRAVARPASATRATDGHAASAHATAARSVISDCHRAQSLIALHLRSSSANVGQKLPRTNAGCKRWSGSRQRAGQKLASTARPPSSMRPAIQLTNAEALSGGSARGGRAAALRRFSERGRAAALAHDQARSDRRVGRPIASGEQVFELREVRRPRSVKSWATVVSEGSHIQAKGWSSNPTMLMSPGMRRPRSW